MSNQLMVINIAFIIFVVSMLIILDAF